MSKQTYTFSRKKILLYSLLPAFVLLAALEGVARLVELRFPPLPGDIGLGFTENSRLFVPDPDAPGQFITNPGKLLSFAAQRFPVRKPPDTVRIVMLGGSSVKHLGPGLALAGKRFALGRWKDCAIETLNAGGLGYGSHRLVPIAAEVLGYAPDLILVYCGHNEFQDLEQLHFARLETVWIQRLLAASALGRLVQDRLAARQIATLEAEHNRRILANANPTFRPGPSWREQFCECSPAQLAERMDAYRTNLARIIETCRARGVPIILGTVPSNLLQPELCEKDAPRYQEVHRLYQHAAYHEASALARRILASTVHHQATDAENRIIRDLAGQYGIPLADVEAAVAAAEPHHIPGETLFEDHCHLNHCGNQLLATTFENTIIQWLEAGD